MTSESINRPDDLLPTRHSLLRRLKNLDDAQSWKVFFDTYWRLIYSVSIRAGLTDAEAQDAVQDTVVSVARNIHAFKVGSAHGSFRGWLLHTTRWRIRDQLRKRLPLAVSTESADGELSPSPEALPDPAGFDFEADWEADWERNLVEAAIERVKQTADPEEFQLFDLHVVKETPAREIARLLGVKLSRVYFAKYKIAHLVRKEIKRLKKQLF